MGEELQPSSVPQPGHPCCQVVLGLLGTSLAMAVLSWGCEVFMLGPEHLEAPVLISLYLWGGRQGGAGGPQPVQALLLPHPSPGDRLVVWAGQAADRQAGAAQGPSSASLHTPQIPKVMLLWHLLCAMDPAPCSPSSNPRRWGRAGHWHRAALKELVLGGQTMANSRNNAWSRQHSRLGFPSCFPS